LEITCGLGGDSSGTWNLTVTATGGTPEKFEKLSIRSKDFKRLQWIGFASMATNQVTFHLDNIQLGTVSSTK